MAEFTNVLLQSHLELEGKTHLVVLTTYSLVWEESSSLKEDSALISDSEPLCDDRSDSIPVNEIISVHIDRAICHETRPRPDACCIEMLPTWPCAFTVSCVKRHTRHRWKVRTLSFGSPDAATCDAWVTHIRSLLSNPALNRPKNLLVFVNPYGGKKAAPKIYREKVAPLFEMSGIYTEVIEMCLTYSLIREECSRCNNKYKILRDVNVTQRANHAQEIMENLNVSNLDGVVCVGGDGMFAEIYNGLLTRTQKLHNNPETLDSRPISPDIRIGIIPAGSTDTVVYSTIGINDPVTSALHIIVGDTLGLDVSSIHNKNHLLCYNVSMLGYGFMGDVVETSEHHRWMGPRRYDYCGFKTILANKSYEGEISFLVSDDRTNHPRDNSRCMLGCKVCQDAKVNDTAASTSLIEMSDRWHRLKGQYMSVNSQTMSCRCTKCDQGPAPSCHLGDGCADLVLISKCSRFDYLRYLIRCANNNSDQFDFPFVQVYRIKEFVFNSLSGDTDSGTSKKHAKKGLRVGSCPRRSSVWNCDGEVIDHADIHVRVHCQLIKIFARGIEEEVIPETPCSRCCPR